MAWCLQLLGSRYSTSHVNGITKPGAADTAAAASGRVFQNSTDNYYHSSVQLTTSTNCSSVSEADRASQNVVLHRARDCVWSNDSVSRSTSVVEFSCLWHAPKGPPVKDVHKILAFSPLSMSTFAKFPVPCVRPLHNYGYTSTQCPCHQVSVSIVSTASTR